MLRLYHFINILSLDVVAGAVISAMFFSRISHVDLDLKALLALALTVWTVYTADHLRDAWFIDEPAASDRHRFHQDHFRTIATILGLVAVLNLVVVFSLDRNTLFVGALLGMPVLIYLIFQQYLRFLKELVVAGLYTAGIILPSLALDGETAETLPWLLAGKFFVTAWMNLLLFSLIDQQHDRKHKHHSFVTRFGPAATRRSIVALGLINILTGIWLWTQDWRAALIFVAMNLLLLTILLFEDRLAVNNYYRMAGDAVFFIPIFYLL